MAYTFRPAERGQAKPLVGLYSESGCGKTWSSLLLARGFVGPTGKVGMIETESGRGEAYADLLPGGYDVLSLRDDFSPRAFGEAITAAEKAHLGALIIDSASHEWDAEGGVLAMANANEEAGRKGMMVWQQPKLDHNRYFMLRVLSTPIPLVVLCMRARYPMEEVLDRNGKKVPQRSTTLVPYQSDKILFEMFLHGWIDPEHRFHGTKYSRDDLRQVLRDGEPITIKTGEALARWAKGGTSPRTGDGGPTPPKPAYEPGAAAGGEPAASSGYRAAILAEIQAIITQYLPGTDEKAKKARAAAIKQIFDVEGWSAVARLPEERLQAGKDRLASVCADYAAQLSAEGAA